MNSSKTIVAKNEELLRRKLKSKENKLKQRKHRQHREADHSVKYDNDREDFSSSKYEHNYSARSDYNTRSNSSAARTDSDGRTSSKPVVESPRSRNRRAKQHRGKQHHLNRTFEKKGVSWKNYVHIRLYKIEPTVKEISISVDKDTGQYNLHLSELPKKSQPLSTAEYVDILDDSDVHSERTHGYKSPRRSVQYVMAPGNESIYADYNRMLQGNLINAPVGDRTSRMHKHQETHNTPSNLFPPSHPLSLSERKRLQKSGQDKQGRSHRYNRITCLGALTQ